MLFGFDDPADVAAKRAPVESPTMPPAPPTNAWLYVALGVVTGLAIAFATWALWPTTDSAMTVQEVETAVVQAMAAQTPTALTSGAAAYEAIAESLVVVRALGEGQTDDAGQMRGSGSNLGGGVVINEQGQILTANHIVAGADTIELVFADGTTTTGRLHANSTALDIAILSPVDNVALPAPAVLGNSRTLQVGEQIYTVGNPLGLTSSLSAGVISGLDRSIPFPGDSGLVLSDLIQFDAAVNQGSSGGPLLNSEGHVIGIVTSLADPDGHGFFVGIGFAVPIDIAAVGAADGPSQ